MSDRCRIKRYRIPSNLVRRILKSGFRDPRGKCSLTLPLSGAARNKVMLSMNRDRLLDVTDWANHSESTRGDAVIGTITEHGREVFKRGYL